MRDNRESLQARIKKAVSLLAGGSSRGLVDEITGLPTLAACYPLLDKALGSGPVGVLFVDIRDFGAVEALFGRDLCEKILTRVGQALRECEVDFFGTRSKLAVCSMGGDDFLIFSDVPAENDAYAPEYERLKSSLERCVNDQVAPFNLGRPLSIHLGYSEIKRRSGYKVPSLVYRAVKDATYSAKTFAGFEKQAHWQLMQRVLQHREISTVFQPVVSLKRGSIFGFEALSRGPRGTALEAPLALFDAAEQFDCLFELERLCHEAAIKNAALDLNDHYLFLNMSPNLLSASSNLVTYLMSLLRDHRIDPQHVVLELTERNQIRDYDTFRASLHNYRNHGFQIAIDDAGSGYSSLQAIAELKPEFIKMDMSLVQGVDQNPTRKAILATFLDFSYKISSRIICEGIENEEEFKVLREIGCEYGQGFLLGYPGDMKELAPEVVTAIQEYSPPSDKPAGNGQNAIGALAMYLEPITTEFRVSQVVERFNEQKVVEGLVVCQDGQPVGLIMRDRLFTMLGTRYGYDLFMRKMVTEIMDSNPLILHRHTPIEEAARRVAERVERGITDYLVLTDGDKYYGVVSVAKLISTMAEIQVQQAREANPLTGLPGNQSITRRISQGLEQNLPLAVLYIDLDNFKCFNDYYGFEHGDRALCLTADLIAQVVRQFGNANDLVGHIGGDDFVVITSPEQAPVICEQLLPQFDRTILRLYDEEAIKRGYIVTLDRSAQPAQIPIMSISISMVNAQAGKFVNHYQLSEAAAEAKKAAKNCQGSCYVEYPSNMGNAGQTR